MNNTREFTKPMDHCCFCGSPAEVSQGALFNCLRCGKYLIPHNWSDSVWKHWSSTQIANASNWIYQNNGIQMSAPLLDFLAQIETPSVGDRATNLLLYLARHAPSPGVDFFPNMWILNQMIEKSRGPMEPLEKDRDFLVNCADMFPLLACSASEGEADLLYLVSE